MEKINLALIYGGTDDKRESKEKKEKPYVIIYINGVPYKIYLNGRVEPVYDR